MEENLPANQDVGNLTLPDNRLVWSLRSRLPFVATVTLEEEELAFQASVTLHYLPCLTRPFWLRKR